MIESATTRAELAAWRDDWQALYRRAGASNLFLTYEWLAAWTEHMKRPFTALMRRPRAGAPPTAATIFVIHEDGRWCWVTEHSYRPGVLHLPGDPAPLRPFLLHAARSGARKVMLHRAVDDESTRAEIARSLGPFRFFQVPREQISSRIIETSQGFDAYLAGRPSKVRQELKRKDRNLAKAGNLALVEPSLDTPEQALALIQEVEQSSWKAASETAITSTDRERNFYRAVLGFAAPRLRARLFALAGASGPVAFVLGVQHDEVYYALKTAYREEQASLSPGQILFYRLVQRFCDEERGVSRIELLGMDARWKKELATCAREERTIELPRPGPAEALRVLALAHAAPALRAAAEEDARMARALEFVRRLKLRLRPPPSETP